MLVKNSEYLIKDLLDFVAFFSKRVKLGFIDLKVKVIVRNSIIFRESFEKYSTTFRTRHLFQDEINIGLLITVCRYG